MRNLPAYFIWSEFSTKEISEKNKLLLFTILQIFFMKQWFDNFDVNTFTLGHTQSFICKFWSNFLWFCQIVEMACPDLENSLSFIITFSIKIKRIFMTLWQKSILIGAFILIIWNTRTLKKVEVWLTYSLFGGLSWYSSFTIWPYLNSILKPREWPSFGIIIWKIILISQTLE